MVIDFIKYKDSLAIKRELVKDRTPLYISHEKGFIYGIENKGNFGDKLQKLRKDIDKLNSLIKDIKQLSKDQENVRQH